MGTRWYETVNEIRAKKLELATIDPRGGMPVMPAGRAGERGIAAVERRIKRPLPPSFRAFLALHDGWQQFYQGAHLLGVRHLARGTYDDVTRLVLDDWEPRSDGGRTRRGPPRHAIVPFGIDARAETIFAFDTSQVAQSGEMEVVVLINEIGERVESFAVFLELVLELLDADVDERRRRQVETRLAPATSVAVAVPRAAPVTARLAAG